MMMGVYKEKKLKVKIMFTDDYTMRLVYVFSIINFYKMFLNSCDVIITVYSL